MTYRIIGKGKAIAEASSLRKAIELAKAIKGFPVLDVVTVGDDDSEGLIVVVYENGNVSRC